MSTATLSTSFPTMTTPLSSSPPTPMHIPSPSSTPTPPLHMAPLKRKRVTNANPLLPRKRKPSVKPPHSSPSPTIAAHSRSPSPEVEIDYSTWGTRRSTPTVSSSSTFPFGRFEEMCLPRQELTEHSRRYLPVGTREMDGEVACVDSADVVKPLITRYYRAYFTDPSGSNFFDASPTNPPEVTLEYPNTNARERYILLSPNDKDHYNPITELMNAVYTIVGYYLLPHEQYPFGSLPAHLLSHPSPTDPPPPPSLTPPTIPNPLPATPTADHLRALEKAYNTQHGPNFLSALSAINALIRQTKPAMMQNVRWGWNAVPPAVWKAVVEECYQRTIGPNVKELGKYQPFSNEVYGELNAMFISDIIFRTSLRANSTFLDLGCGVGNCLIQASLQSGCTSRGVEINPPPASLGARQIAEFKKRCVRWGLESGKVEMIQGDFCEDEVVRGEWIRGADVVLVNNWAFSASLNERLSLLFLDLPDSTKIVSLKPFRRPEFRLTDRTAGSPAAILTVEEVPFKRGAVSWMAEGGVYWLHTVDREPLRRFLEEEIGRKVKKRGRKAAMGPVGVEEGTV